MPTEIPPGNDPFPMKFLDLTMLTIPGGKERSREEYEQLLSSAGFELAQIVPTTGPPRCGDARLLSFALFRACRCYFLRSL